MDIRPIHVTNTPENVQVQAIDVRFYFPAELSRDEVLRMLNEGVRDFRHLSATVSAYELVSDGFGHLVPDDKPLALAGNFANPLDFAIGQRVYLP